MCFDLEKTPTPDMPILKEAKWCVLKDVMF
jgi:hypothetical protein